MNRAPLRLLFGVLGLLASACGSAADGAAVVRGRLFTGSAPWETSFDFVGPVRLHGAGPLRIAITDAIGTPSPAEANDRVPQRAIEIALPTLSPGGGPVLVGSPKGPRIRVESRTAAFTAWPDPLEGEVRLPDGSFVARPVSGFVELELEGNQPGDGARGRFVLEMPTGVGGALERLEGRFAGTLID